MGMTGAMSSATAGRYMAASAGVSALGAIGNTFAQYGAVKAKGAYDQSVAETNAKISNLEARQAIEAGDIEASRMNLKTRATAGALKAVQAGSGTSVNSGSNALVRAGIKMAGAIDELTIRNNAARRAWGFKTQAITDTYAGQVSRMTASNLAQQTLLSGGLQAIESPMTIYANYMRWSRYLGGTGGPGGQPFDLSTK
jgi:hypothetical protein